MNKWTEERKIVKMSPNQEKYKGMELQETLVSKVGTSRGWN
jgi:hypothetical protein